MHIRALVAKTDGVPGRDGLALAPGSIAPTENVPVTINFDTLRCIGRATITVVGNDVFADFDVVDADIRGQFPALGYWSKHSEAMTTTLAVPFTVAICDNPNTDPRILPIE